MCSEADPVTLPNGMVRRREVKYLKEWLFMVYVLLVVKPWRWPTREYHPYQQYGPRLQPHTGPTSVGTAMRGMLDQVKRCGGQGTERKPDCNGRRQQSCKRMFPGM
jgi:hypothetical protein